MIAPAWLDFPHPQEGGTPLLHACKAGNKETIKVLLKHGADPTVKDSEGETPATAAANKGIDIAELQE